MASEDSSDRGRGASLPRSEGPPPTTLIARHVRSCTRFAPRARRSCRADVNLRDRWPFLLIARTGRIVTPGAAGR
jgi:hypothetical protein